MQFTHCKVNADGTTFTQIINTASVLANVSTNSSAIFNFNCLVSVMIRRRQCSTHKNLLKDMTFVLPESHDCVSVLTHSSQRQSSVLSSFKCRWEKASQNEKDNRRWRLSSTCRGSEGPIFLLKYRFRLETLYRLALQRKFGFLYSSACSSRTR